MTSDSSTRVLVDCRHLSDKPVQARAGKLFLAACSRRNRTLPSCRPLDEFVNGLHDKTSLDCLKSLSLCLILFIYFLNIRFHLDLLLAACFEHLSASIDNSDPRVTGGTRAVSQNLFRFPCFATRF